MKNDNGLKYKINNKIGCSDTMGKITTISSRLGICCSNNGKSMGRCNACPWYDKVSKTYLWILNS